MGDTVAGFIALAQCEAALGEEVNIATQAEISIGQLAAELIRQINPDAVLRQDSDRLRPEKSEVERLLGSNEKIKRLTGWSPQHDFQEGIRKTITWFRERENLIKYKHNVYNI